MGAIHEQYVGLGFAIFPVKGKVPLTRHGFKDAECSIRAYALWNAHPDAGIAIATGARSGNIVVIDIDERHGGDESFGQLQRELGGTFQTTACTTTPSGGQHYYFRLPEGVSVRSGVGFRPGIDIRADGGYVVAPDSPGYAWDVAPWDLDPGLADCPAKLLALLVAKPGKKSDEGSGWNTGGFVLPDIIPAGGRDNTLTRYAGVLRRGGMDTEAIYEHLQMINDARCSPQLPNEDLKRIARSIGAKAVGLEDAADKIDRLLPPEKKEEGAPTEFEHFVDRAGVLRKFVDYSNYEVISTGLPLLDTALGGGLWSKQTTVLIGPTGAGKTALALQMARRVCVTRPVLIWTMEMAPEVLASRMAAQESGDNHLDILRDESVRARNLGLIPESVYYYEGRDIEKLILCTRKVSAEHAGKAPLVIVDYMQKAPSQNEDPRQRLTEISEVLRQMAIRLELFVLAISSASRAGSTMLRQAYKYLPEELVQTGKESGDIEYDANTVITVGLVEDDSEEPERKACVTVAKARFGRTGHLEYGFSGARGVWREVDKWQQEEPKKRAPKLGADDLEEAVWTALKNAGGTVPSKRALRNLVKGARTGAIDDMIDDMIARGRIIVLPTGGLRLASMDL